jgi:endogenous inhibitor of DNA gyrase (YacG/DUF329 family)
VPADTRTCPVCWNSFTLAVRNSAQHTYCSDRCRAEAGRRRRRRDHHTATTSATHPPTPRPYRPQPAAQRDCPHCGQPVTIVALLTTPQIAGPQIAGPQQATATPDVIPLHPIRTT